MLTWKYNQPWMYIRISNYQENCKNISEYLNPCLYEEGKKTCSPHVTISFPVENMIWARDYELILSILKAMRTRISTNVELRLKWHDTKSYSRDHFYSTLLFGVIGFEVMATSGVGDEICWRQLYMSDRLSSRVRNCHQHDF